jgi:hypothetical protein
MLETDPVDDPYWYTFDLTEDDNWNNKKIYYYKNGDSDYSRANLYSEADF